MSTEVMNGITHPIQWARARCTDVLHVADDENGFGEKRFGCPSGWKPVYAR
jgi:hypothetical protein